ncbi:hypothetical protein F383_20503 [Gossypium arboreum]|uniref:Pentatricopeptide repeat-containing protein At2g26790, mitochondrial-like n=1 Tax=Gossypium arboreum TaxID=29729 RepID=A0A0B0MHV8_GOSAR|nr:hypothetical protein F383_20503 [Gossypium arboreum]
MLGQSLWKTRPALWSFSKFSPIARKEMHYALDQLASSSSDEQEIIGTPNMNHFVNRVFELHRVEVVETLNTLREQPDKALSFFNRLKEDEGLEGEDSNLLVRLSNALVKAYLKRLGLKANDYTYGIMIKAFCRKGNFEKVVGIFQEMDEARVRPNAVAYTTYIEGLCMHGRTEFGYEVLKAWRESKIPLDDAFAYYVVIKGFCDEMKLEEAADVLFEAELHGIVLDTFPYGALIRGYCKCVADALCKAGKVEEAVELLDEMKGKQISPDIINYTTLINGYCLQGKVEDAVNLFKEMLENGHKPDIVSFNVLVGGLARNGHARKAIGLLNHAEKQGLQCEIVMRNMIIKGLCIGGKVSEAEDFLDSLPDKCFENDAALVDGYIESRLTKKAFKLFLKLANQGFLVRKASCSKLLSSLCKDGENYKALMLLKVMSDLNVEPTKLMYSQLIGAFFKAGNCINAQLLFDQIFARRQTPDLVIYTIMISGYCKMNLLQEALLLFNNMNERGIKPDVITYTVLINSHLKLNLVSLSSPDAPQNKDKKIMDASTFWREMKDKEIEPDVVCYTVLIDYYCRTNNLWDAIRIFDQMIESGLEPDNATYMTLISGYCKRGYLARALNLFEEMYRRGIQPDMRTISTVDHCILKAKRVSSHTPHKTSSRRMSKFARLALSGATVGLQPKRRAVLKDVTNVCDDTSYMDCKNATKNRPKLRVPVDISGLRDYQADYYRP